MTQGCDRRRPYRPRSTYEQFDYILIFVGILGLVTHRKTLKLGDGKTTVFSIVRSTGVGVRTRPPGVEVLLDGVRTSRLLPSVRWSSGPFPESIGVHRKRHPSAVTGGDPVSDKEPLEVQERHRDVPTEVDGVELDP